jgi:AsmA protein
MRRVRADTMRPWGRRILVALAALLLVLAALATWMVRGFDGERVKRKAIDWMQAQHGRELVIDGPLTLQLWPQPAVTVQRVRLSEPGQPGQRFASIEEASLTLHLEPLLVRREIEVDRITAQGVRVSLRRDAEGRRNVADLMARAAGDGERRAAEPWTVEGIELDGVDLDLEDALSGLAGRVAVRQLRLGRLGPGLVSHLHLQGQASLTQPALSAAVVLDTGFDLQPADRPGAALIVRLDKPSLQLRGQGFGVESLDARLQAGSVRLDYGAASGIGDSRVELDGVRLQVAGNWLGWRLDHGELGLARLRLDVQQRTLELGQFTLKLAGRQAQTTLDAALTWPALKVLGETLQGGPMSGRIALGGDQDLRLELSSQSPSGKFERITVPAVHVDIDGRIGPATVRGQGGATLVLEPKPFAATLDGLSVGLDFSDPALPPMQLALDGQAQLSARSGSARLAGTVNAQRVRARLDAALDRPRPFVDVDASFGTLDLNRFVAPASRAAATSRSDAARPVNLQALRWADARLRVKVDRLLRPPYRIDALDVDAGIRDGVLDVRRFAGRAWGGRFEASGSADSASGQLGLRLLANDVDLRALLADTLGYDGLQGRGRIDADLRSRGATVGAVRAALSGSAALALRPAALRGIDLAQTLRAWRTATQAGGDVTTANAGRQTDFSQLGASFEVRDGVARSTDLDGRSDFLRVGGEGTIDFVQGRVDYLLRARVEGTSTGRAGPEMAMLNGVTVPVDLHGPFGNVEWQVRWPAVTAAVAALSVPNVVRGTVGGVTRGATSVLRGATGALRSGTQGPPAPP